ncbi:MAG TPA: amino acid permease, partial [Blastocatellia bacterium]|nr:amino acid permease [Blastocatellia bacterium]
EDLLAEMGMISAGWWLQLVVSIDAALVLSGAVLTSYVGVTGLVRRMTLDRCMPQFLLRENTWRGTNHWIIGLFFLLSCSVLVMTAGKIEALAGVYTLSFLGVMALFAAGNMLLKVKRARLPRTIRAGWPTVLFGFLAVWIGLVGNLMLNPEYVRVFGAYFTIALAVVGIMFLRVEILKALLAILRAALDRAHEANRRVSRWIVAGIDRINSQGMIFFTRGDNLATLNRAALYVLKNEHTKRLKVVHCYEREEEIPADLAEQIRTIDRIYPEMCIDLVLVKGRFGPELIERLSRRLGVPKNYMFIGTPGDHFPHRISDLGGVRLIM